MNEFLPLIHLLFIWTSKFVIKLVLSLTVPLIPKLVWISVEIIITHMTVIILLINGVICIIVSFLGLPTGSFVQNPPAMGGLDFKYYYVAHLWIFRFSSLGFKPSPFHLLPIPWWTWAIILFSFWSVSSFIWFHLFKIAVRNTTCIHVYILYSSK